MSVLYAIDPGTEQSALVMLGPNGDVTGWLADNAAMLVMLTDWPMIDDAPLVIEEVASYGMPVGREVFQTVFWAGRFAQAWVGRPRHQGYYGRWSMLPRRAVKLALCGSARAKDANIRQALIDRYGGKAKAVGNKKAPGPLYGLRSHCWAALALAVTYQDQNHG